MVGSFGASVLEPGETIDIRIELNNDGSTDALSVRVRLPARAHL